MDNTAGICFVLFFFGILVILVVYALTGQNSKVEKTKKVNKYTDRPILNNTVSPMIPTITFPVFHDFDILEFYKFKDHNKDELKSAIDKLDHFIKSFTAVYFAFINNYKTSKLSNTANTRNTLLISGFFFMVYKLIDTPLCVLPAAITNKNFLVSDTGVDDEYPLVTTISSEYEFLARACAQQLAIIQISRHNGFCSREINETVIALYDVIVSSVNDYMEYYTERDIRDNLHVLKIAGYIHNLNMYEIFLEEEPVAETSVENEKENDSSNCTDCHNAINKQDVSAPAEQNFNSQIDIQKNVSNDIVDNSTDSSRDGGEDIKDTINFLNEAIQDTLIRVEVLTTRLLNSDNPYDVDKLNQLIHLLDVVKSHTEKLINSYLTVVNIYTKFEKLSKLMTHTPQENPSKLSTGSSLFYDWAKKYIISACLEPCIRELKSLVYYPARLDVTKKKLSHSLQRLNYLKEDDVYSKMNDIFTKLSIATETFMEQF